MKLILSIALMMISALSLAHSGHSETNIMIHDAEHMMWMASGLVLLALTAGFYLLKKR